MTKKLFGMITHTSIVHRERIFLMRPWAWYLQGQGFEAKTDSPERDVVKAAICYNLAAKEVHMCKSSALILIYESLTFILSGWRY